MAVAKPKGRWCCEEQLRLSATTRRYEIIEGELYGLPSPDSDRALAVINLIAVLLPAVGALGGKLFTAPLDVVFRGADPVRPDLLVVMPDRLDLISKRGIEGAPDVAIEVLNPSNSEHDRITKRALDAGGGVREYWLVSPEAAPVEVLALDGDGYRTYLRAGGDELVTSTALSGLAFAASAIFAP